jgi:hypothetical protein
MAVVLFSIIGLKYLDTTLHPYDSLQLHSITHSSIKDVYQSFSKPVVSVFLYRCMANYWIGILLLTIGTASLVSKKKWKLAGWTIASFLGYIAIMGLTYSELGTDTLLFHIESEWSAIGIIAATPFVFSYLPTAKFSFSSAALIAVFCVRLIYISHTIPDFSWRIHFQNEVFTQMKKKGISKLALYREQGLQSKYMLDWSTPYESLLSSSVGGAKPAMTFTFINPENGKDILNGINSSKYIYVPWPMPINSLNRNYFILDTTTPYTVMTYAELMR